MHALQLNRRSATIHEYLPLWSPNKFDAEVFDFVDNDGDYGGVGSESLDVVNVDPLSPSDPGINQVRDGGYDATRTDLDFDLNNPYVDEDGLGLFVLGKEDKGKFF